MFQQITHSEKYVWINSKICVKLSIIETFEIIEKDGKFSMILTDYHDNTYETTAYDTEKELIDKFKTWFN